MKFEINSHVEIGKLKTHGSPTNILREHLMYSFAGDATKPLTLSRLVLVDTDGAERDYASIDPAKWSMPVVGSRRQTVIVLITSNYSVASIRLYAGTNIYFEHTLPEPYSVTAGSKLAVTVTIRALLSYTHESGGVLERYHIPEEGLDSFIRRITEGTDKGVKPASVRIYYGGTALATFSGSVSYDPANLQVVFHAEYAPATDQVINRYDYILSNGETLLEVFISDVALPGGVTHTWDLKINF